MATSTVLGKRGSSPGGGQGAPKKQKKGSPGKGGRQPAGLGNIPQEMRDAIYRFLQPSYLYLHVDVHPGLVFRDTLSTVLGDTAAIRATSSLLRYDMGDHLNHEDDCIVVDMVMDQLLNWRLHHNSRPWRPYEQTLAPQNLNPATVVQESDNTIGRFNRLRFIVPFTFINRAAGPNGRFTSLLSVAHVDIRRVNGTWVLQRVVWRDIHNGGFQDTDDAQDDANGWLDFQVRAALGAFPLSRGQLWLLANGIRNSIHMPFVPGVIYGTATFNSSISGIDMRHVPWNVFGRRWSAEARALTHTHDHWWRFITNEW